MKLAVVGPGSTYTPELVDGLVRMPEALPVAAAARLHDLDRFDPSFPASVVHDHEDAAICLDRAALPC